MKDNIDIEKLANLARIDLADTDIDEITDNISNVLAYVASVEEVAADGDSGPSVGPVHNVLREDADPHEPGAYREVLLAEAPKTDDEGFIVVPPILN